MRFDRVVPVNEADQFYLAVPCMLESGLAVPHLHDRSDASFSLPVGVWVFHLGESLFNLVLGTEFHEGVIPRTTFVFEAIVRVPLFNGVWAFNEHLFEECLGRILGLVR